MQLAICWLLIGPLLSCAKWKSVIYAKLKIPKASPCSVFAMGNLERPSATAVSCYF